MHPVIRCLVYKKVRMRRLFHTVVCEKLRVARELPPIRIDLLYTKTLQFLRTTRPQSHVYKRPNVLALLMSLEDGQFVGRASGPLPAVGFATELGSCIHVGSEHSLRQPQLVRASRSGLNALDRQPQGHRLLDRGRVKRITNPVRSSFREGNMSTCWGAISWITNDSMR